MVGAAWIATEHQPAVEPEPLSTLPAPGDSNATGRRCDVVEATVPLSGDAGRVGTPSLRPGGGPPADRCSWWVDLSVPVSDRPAVVTGLDHTTEAAHGRECSPHSLKAYREPPSPDHSWVGKRFAVVVTAVDQRGCTLRCGQVLTELSARQGRLGPVQMFHVKHRCGSMTAAGSHHNGRPSAPRRGSAGSLASPAPLS